MNENQIKGYTIGPHGYRYNNIILAMQEKWAEKILDGSKTIELRRSRPGIGRSTPPGITIYLYCKRSIIGECLLENYREIWTPEDIMTTAAPLYKEAGMNSPEEVQAYLQGAARPCYYRLKNARRYPRPIPWPTVVQSWMYAY